MVVFPFCYVCPCLSVDRCAMDSSVMGRRWTCVILAACGIRASLAMLSMSPRLIGHLTAKRKLTIPILREMDLRTIHSTLLEDPSISGLSQLISQWWTQYSMTMMAPWGKPSLLFTPRTLSREYKITPRTLAKGSSRQAWSPTKRSSSKHSTSSKS